jgi:riboflavin kinase/FMN adenylyltransferase
VFAVELFGIEGEPVRGVANVGNRPTVDGTRSLLEVHLFDFNKEIYGRHVQVEFLHKLRPERRFESFDALKRQIEEDAARARAWFGE